MNAKEIEERARELHARSIVIDALNISKFDRPYFLKLREGGITAINATVAAYENFRETMDKIAWWHEQFDKNSDVILHVTRTADIRKAKETGRVGIILGFQNASPIEDNLGFVKVFHLVGVRIIQLVYMARNFLGDGCLERNPTGLSHFGLEVVKEMNRLGIVIDLSHVGDQTTQDAIDFSKQPVAITHSNSRVKCDVPRNKPDAQLKQVAAKGGVIGVVGYPTFVTKKPNPTIEDYLDMMDCMVNLVGVDHIGIGIDWVEGQPEGFLDRGLGYSVPAGLVPKWPWVYPEGLRTATDFPNITRGLVRRGYSDEDIQKILGLNWLHYFERIWGG